MFFLLHKLDKKTCSYNPYFALALGLHFVALGLVDMSVWQNAVIFGNG